MSHLYSHHSPNVGGCCIIGIFLAVFYALWHIIRAVVILSWRIAVYFFKFAYYFYVWPLLAFEYLWKRGGIYRLLGIGLLVIVAFVFISALLSRPTPNSPVAPQPAEAAQVRTATLTRSVTRTAMRTVTRSATRKPSATRTPSQTPIPTTVTTITKPADAQAVQVVRVVDGDTVIVMMNNQQVRLRLIGIDTPESVDPRQPVQCFGIEASNYTRKALTNQTIYLERDLSQGEYDIYNRLLVYIWLDDTTLFNQQIIADGYAFEYTYRLPYRYQTLFKTAQQTARTTNNGLWSPTTCNGNVNTGGTTTALVTTSPITSAPTGTMTATERAYPCEEGQIKGNPDSMVYHIPTGRWYAQTRNNRVTCFGTEQEATLAGYRKSSN